MRKYSQTCPIARTLDLVGDRWTLLIVRDLFMGASKFGDFRGSSPGMPPKVLSARLKWLMSSGLIEREIYSLHPLRAEYRLTEKGRSLLPVLLTIGQWGLENEFAEEPEAQASISAAIAARIPEARPMLRKGGFI